MDVTEIADLLAEVNSHGIRLWAAGGKLHYRAVTGAMTESIRVKLRQRKDGVLQALSGPVYRPRGVRLREPILDFYHGYWGRIRSGAIHVGVLNTTFWVARFSGHLNLDALKASFDALTTRHSILTARVAEGPNGPEFVFDQALAVTLRVVDLSDADSDSREPLAQAKASELIWSRFDAEHDPLFRPFFIKISATESVVGFVVHHFICDWSSIVTMRSELTRDYVEYDSSRVLARAPPLQYTDYVSGMNEWLRGANAQIRLAYWKQQLKNAPATRIPPDHDEGRAEEGDVNIDGFHIAADVVVTLQEFCKSKRVTLFAVLLAAKMCALSCLLKSSDIVVLSMYDGRDDPRLDGMVGATMRRLALRASIRMDMSFRDLIVHIHDVCVVAYENMIPYRMIEPILDEIGAAKSFPLMNFINTSAGSSVSHETASRLTHFQTTRPTITGTPKRFSNYWMRLTCNGSGINGHVGYSSLVYRRETIGRFLQLFTRVLNTAGRDTAQRVSTLLADT